MVNVAQQSAWLVRQVGDALRAAGVRDAPGHDAPSGVVLAVSGGRDSMVLLDLAARGAPDTVHAVATFDHATGAHATEAAELVESTARAYGFPVIVGRAERDGRTEAAWRASRWAFFRRCMGELGAAAVATAHTRDDQCETVVMRAFRGTSARGLAALAAQSAGVVRPLGAATRAVLAAYAADHRVRWIDDPSNADRRHLRVRVRHDLLPSIERASPGTSARVLATATAAAAHRADVDRWAARLCVADASSDAGYADDGIMTESLRPISATPRVLVETLTALNADALALFWPAFAARAGARLDRRAIARLVAFTTRTIACLQDGTIQPALIPIAGRVDPERSDDSNTTPRDNASDVGTAHIRQHIVHLVYAPVRAPVHTWIYRARRAWQFSVRNDLVSGRSWHGGASVV